MNSETDSIRERYSRRNEKGSLYSDEDPYYRSSRREFEDAVRMWAAQTFQNGLGDIRLMEVGCGHGKNLRLFLDMGCTAANVAGCDLLESRVSDAKAILPSECQLLAGDACELDWPDDDFDAVVAATVFSSILDRSMRRALAAKMWRLAKPGGGILWYDFVYDNPKNPDVAGITLNEVRSLFPVDPISVRRLTLAPPIGRRVSRIHPSMYGLFNAIPILRTHILCWIRKP